MRTEKGNISINPSNPSATDARFAALARMGEEVFHARDAAVMWGITNPNTLHTTLSRYVRAGLLFRLRNGLYAVKPSRDLDPLFIGTKALHGPCYVSMETVLARAGVIQQHVPRTTLVSGVSRQFELGGHAFRSRRLADTYLLNETGIVCERGMRIATPVRAIADMLYFNPKYHFDASAHIDWDAVNRLQAEVGYPLTHRSITRV